MEELKLTEKQASALTEMKEQLKDKWKPIMNSDRWLLKFLHARNFDVRKSVKMVRKTLLWRSRSDTENILSTWTIPDMLKRFLPGGFCGHDLEGRPCWLEPFGKGDFVGLSRVANCEQILRTRHYFAEYIESVLLPECSKKEGKLIDQIVVIYDMEGIGREHLQRPGLTTFQLNIALALENYPESLHRTYVINAPKLFTALNNLLKPLMDAETQKKITILGTNYKEELLKDFAPDQLPVCYGGTKVDENNDPLCSSLINYGGSVPKELYSKFPQDFEFVQVGSGQRHSVEIEVSNEEIGHHLHWEFWTEEHDINFEIVFKGKPNGPPPKGPPVSSPWCKKASLFCAGIEENESCDGESSIEILEQQVVEEEEKEEEKNVEQEVTKLVDETNQQLYFLVLPRRRVSCYTIPECGEMVCSVAGTYIVSFDNHHSWARAKKLHHKIKLLPASTQL